MDRSTIVRTGIAGAVAAAGLAVGGVAMASADTGDTGDTNTSSTARPGRPDGGRQAAALADELGIEEATVRAALDKVREQLRPDEPSSTDGTRTPPTDAERAERQAAFAKALAAELDLSQAQVTTALEAIRAEARTEGRERLEERLDTAVEEGKLTAADKASVLKAFDAEVLGGGPHGHGRG